MSALKLSGLLIIADDLSGAADCAAGFAKRLSTEIVLDTETTSSTAAVVAVDVDSRRLDPGAAAKANSAVLQQRQYANRALYKKIDSTLRGNVASEIAALQALRGLAIVAPAFPAMGRTTQDAVQLINGISVALSDVWRNENLLGTGNLLESLSAEGLRCMAINLDTLRDETALSNALDQALSDKGRSKVQALICDALTDTDLQRLARATAPLYRQLFWVGSAGLAHHLPEALGLPASGDMNVRGRSPVLTVIGSMSQHSQHQARTLAEHSGCFCLEIDAATLLDPSRHEKREQLITLLCLRLAKGEDSLLTLSQEERDPSVAAQLSSALAAWLEPVIAVTGSLIATGGETARAILTAAGIGRLEVQGELAPGVVLSRTETGLNVVTKAGAFGQPDTLLTAWQQLHGRSTSTADTPHIKKEIHHV
ncbi:four-carbon acid sugar kinase family protein [Pseudomonas quasicaspiana]|uniref:four-carbon acid sugar kinase family protein n=1 Tax=Pseudomonas quasicaspiana TaxID=2829821 RepID=UPI001E39B878|nr:four-carbon acid sugar kinase family protein [Pseudomonas quasicaspiana]MCD5976342.1 four-carbon acid sugar kinase family protein [Pseudomonas quasicaspiana]